MNRSKGRWLDTWCALLEGSDACFAPVIPLHVAPTHPHLVARGTYGAMDGRMQAAPVPKFSRTPGNARPSRDDGRAVLEEWAANAPFDSTTSI
ncbi:hypothetical protein BH09PSE3_BH09PSE3_21520 [soil metagenome]